jgi:hypothetical protein
MLQRSVDSLDGNGDRYGRVSSRNPIRAETQLLVLSANNVELAEGEIAFRFSWLLQ